MVMSNKASLATMEEFAMVALALLFVAGAGAPNVRVAVEATIPVRDVAAVEETITVKELEMSGILRFRLS